MRLARVVIAVGLAADQVLPPVGRQAEIPAPILEAGFLAMKPLCGKGCTDRLQEGIPRQLVDVIGDYFRRVMITPQFKLIPFHKQLR